MLTALRFIADNGPVTYDQLEAHGVHGATINSITGRHYTRPRAYVADMVGENHLRHFQLTDLGRALLQKTEERERYRGTLNANERTGIYLGERRDV
jgi:hypothetical protein